MTKLLFPFSYNLHNNTILEPYNDEYKEIIKGEVKKLLDLIGDAFRVDEIVCSSHFCKIQVISKENQTYQPKKNEKLQPEIFTFFEQTICGETRHGYTSNYGWGEEERENEPGMLDDYFPSIETPVKGLAALESAFYHWLKENDIPGDSMEGPVQIRIVNMNWEDESIFN